jgi:uncharacterized protein (TIGR02118 family)
MIKMVFCVKRKPSISETDFYNYWLDMHGPLVSSKVEDLGIKRYVQSHTKRADLGNTASSGRGMKQAAFDGLAEIWWESFEHLETVLATEPGQIAGAILAEDEARFIDMEASTIFFTEEHEVVAPD